MSLGIFALLAVFGIIAQVVATSTVKSVKNTNQYYAAKDIADSVVESLQFKIASKGPGYNWDLDDVTAEGECNYEDVKQTSSSDDGEEDEPGTDGSGKWNEWKDDYDEEDNPIASVTQGCADLFDIVPITDENNDPVGHDPGFSNLDIAGKGLVISGMNVKGTSKEEDKFDYAHCDYAGMLGASNGCYSTPIRGTGDAVESPDIDCSNIEIINNLDHPCNWNVLKHGSEDTSIVTIPLYTADTENAITQDKYKFIVRVRPSCKKKYGESAAQPASGLGYDPCENNRWTLAYESSDENKAVVQWGIKGLCEGEVDGEESECSFEDYQDESAGLIDSWIDVERINNGIGDAGNNIVLDEFFQAIQTGGFGNLEQKGALFEYLVTMIKPKLTLKLASQIKKAYESNGGTENNENPLYLEYQVLTENPIASPKVKMEVQIEVNGTLFEKTIYKYEEKELIDYAVQS